MKTTILAAALAVSGFAALAQAQTTVIEERSSPSVTTIERDRPAASTTTIERREPAVATEKRTTIETTGQSRDCSTKSLHKEGMTGSTTVTKTDCD